ncbi:MAG: trigger factor [bacterium]|nr:trigger factor [bacterium]
MNINKNNNEGKEIEITVELSIEELKPYLEQAAKKISEDLKIEGFRPGYAPYEIVKKQVGAMHLAQEAADRAIRKTADKALQEQTKDEKIVGQPQVRVTKLAADNPLEYKIIVPLMPEITLGSYKDLKIKKNSIEVKDEEADKVLNDLRQMRAKEAIKTGNASVQDGDKVVVNIAMYLDNVPVEGGQSKETAILVGANYIIPGFDKKLLGAKKNESREFKLEYPADHYQKNLAGKMVEFKVDINEIYERELPEINDDLAKILGMKDLAVLKEQIKLNLKQEKEQKADQKAVLEIFEKILNKTIFSHVPETMIHSEIHNMLDELKHNVEQQGGNFGDYLMHIKKTPEDLEHDLAPDAEKRVKTALAISQIVKIEEIKISEAETQKALDKQLEVYADNPEWKKKAETPEYKHYLSYNLLNQKVIEKLREWNIGK